MVVQAALAGTIDKQQFVKYPNPDFGELYVRTIFVIFITPVGEIIASEVTS